MTLPRLSMRFRLGDRVDRNHSAMPNCAAVGCTHFREPMADEFQKPLLISTGRSFSTGELRTCGSCFGQWSYGPPGLCDRESSSSRPLARHLETCRQPNGGVWRPCPNQRNKSDRKENTRQPQLQSMPASACPTPQSRLSRKKMHSAASLPGSKPQLSQEVWSTIRASASGSRLLLRIE